jgi:hypothetical protein
VVLPGDPKGGTGLACAKNGAPVGPGRKTFSVPSSSHLRVPWSVFIVVGAVLVLLRPDRRVTVDLGPEQRPPLRATRRRRELSSTFRRPEVLLTPDPYPRSWTVPGNDPRPEQVDSAAAGGRRRIDLESVNTGMHELVPSADPAVVFDRLARLCVPAVCDIASADVFSGDRLARWLELTAHQGQPATPSRSSSCGSNHIQGPAGRYTLTVYAAGQLNHAQNSDAPDYLAALTCSWLDGYRPGPADVALLELLCRCATGITLQHSQAAHLATQTNMVTQLRVALDSNRKIGAAIGVLMTHRHFTYEQGLKALLTTSQNTNRKMADLADDVLYTGELPEPSSSREYPPLE